MTAPLKVIYEDNHLLVVDKPVGLLSQADSTGRPDLLTICKAYIKEKYGKPGDVYLGLVQRLDLSVSGVIVFARTSKAAARLSEQIREREPIKIYQALVAGDPPHEGHLEGFYYKDEEALMARKTERGKPGAKRASLSFRRLNSSDATHQALLEITLETGRFHQIRVQLSDAGYPILGDEKYGGPRHKSGMALRCVSLTIQHPTRKELMTFKADEDWTRAFA